jgi:hypothetical protein
VTEAGLRLRTRLARSSTTTGAVAVERAIRIARQRGWRRRAFVQHHDGDVLDAVLLLVVEALAGAGSAGSYPPEVVRLPAAEVAREDSTFDVGMPQSELIPTCVR